jgi:hypothetical protein
VCPKLFPDKFLLCNRLDFVKSHAATIHFNNFDLNQRVIVRTTRVAQLQPLPRVNERLSSITAVVLPTKTGHLS